MYFECAECGQLADYVDHDRSRLQAFCPVCDERTLWTVAFSDSEKGVSF